jgi:hypothetical protein
MRARREKNGPQGKAFTYDDFTEEQLKALQGPKGDKGESVAQVPTGAVMGWNSEDELPEGYELIGTFEALTNMELEDLINSQV